jgi:glycosyltransferase involved in cell wall biosynthesis
MSGRRWRIAVHALDRTGPPMLALTFVRWLASVRADDAVEVVALRGGPLLDTFLEYAAVRVLLDHHEPWNADRADPRRVAELAGRLDGLLPADATLLVSVSAGATLAWAGSDWGPIVTWVVEEEEGYPAVLVDRTDIWLAGAARTRTDVQRRVGSSVPVRVVDEFVEAPGPLEGADRERRRSSLGITDDDLLLVSAGIATSRKGPDLFAELVTVAARSDDRIRGLWIGGEEDELFPHLQHASRRSGGRLRVLPGVADLGAWFQAADVVVHTARFDSFPNVCLLAAMAGRPVVSFSGTGGVEDMFGPTFLGAPYPDLGALAAALGTLADDEHRQHTAAAQRAHLGSTHDVRVVAPLLLRELLAAAPPEPG